MLPLRPIHSQRIQEPLVVASVDQRTPTLRGMDMIRLDGAQASMVELSRLRTLYPCPAMLDIPGPHTRRRGNPLTTSEFLVYAAAEGFEMVNLTGVRRAREIQRAREFLPASTRLAVTVTSGGVFRRFLDEICAAADLLIVSRKELVRSMGVARSREVIGVAIAQAAAKDKPCLLVSGLLPSMMRQSSPTPGEIDRLTGVLEEGCEGFVLVEETLEGDYPQSCVDVLRLLGETCRASAATAAVRSGARLSGDLIVLPELAL